MPQLIFSIRLIGDQGVGKTSILMSVAGNKETPIKSAEYCPISMSFEIVRGEKTVSLIVTDTGGQEKYRSLTASYYRGAHGCLVLYDVTKESSFDSINYWLHDLKEYTSQPEISTILVGTKCHVKPEQRQVSFERAQKYAESLGLPYMEVSAEEGTNVTEVFEKLADLIIESMEKLQAPIAMPSNKVTLTDSTKKSKSWCSC